jgi:predicted nucleotide-binding protein
MSTLQHTNQERQLAEKLFSFSIRELRERLPSHIFTQLDVRDLVDTDKRKSMLEDTVIPLLKPQEVEDILVNDFQEKAAGKVFIVYGNSQSANEKLREVENFCLKAKIEYIIFRNEINGGKTIIEKLESLSALVSYAIILYTGCDEGRKKSTSSTDELPLKPRARQNVIFEHGYFTAKLGRSRVCVLKEVDIENSLLEQASDNSGILYINIGENTDWKTSLAKELIAQKIVKDIDLLNL